MCQCMGKGGKYRPFVSISEAEKIKLAKRLPQVLENRKKILAKQLEKNYEKTADKVFFNGKIYTMKSKQQKDLKNWAPEVAEAVAIQGQNIISVGSFDDIQPFMRKDTQLINLDGRTMLPGFIEPHVHMTTQVAGSWIDFSPFTNSNMTQIKKKLISEIQKVTVKDTWIKAKLYDPSITPDPNDDKLDVSRWGLDELIRIQGKEHMGVCIYIMQANGHIAYVNTPALYASHIYPQSTIPYGQYVKDENGELTGQLRQSAVFAIQQVVPPIDEYKENFKNFLKHSASKGVTTLSDGGIGSMEQGDVTILNEVFSPQQNPIVRYSGFLVYTKWDTWLKLHLKPDFKDPLLRIRGIKCFCDGSIQGGSGFMREPYKDQQSYGYGVANYTLKQLVFSINDANKNGWQVAIHGNGDAGIDRILDAFEINQTINPQFNQGLRNRIQHCTIVNYDQLQKMKRFQVYPSFLIGHIYYYGNVFIDMLGEQRASLVDPVKSAIELGLRPTLHSDHGCQPIDPIRCIYNAVTRIIRYEDKVLNEKQCITPYEAIKAVTIDAAWQCHFDDIVGSIQVGKKADFVILDRDPLAIPPKELINLKVEQTWMNGRITYKEGDLKSDNSAELFASLRKKKHQPVEHHMKEEKHEHAEHPKKEEKHQHVEHPKKETHHH